MLGTGGHGHTFPGPAVPFGQIQLGPDNGKNGWDWSSGYHYSDSLIAGFSLTHLSGTGIGDLCDILLMPTLDEIDTTYFDYNERICERLKSSFSHKNENAEVGYYSVLLDKYEIVAELTTSKRVGMHKYIFPKKSEPQIVVDLGYSVNHDRTDTTYIKMIDNHRIVGYRFSKGWAANQKVFFAIDFSEAFNQMDIFTQDGVFSEEAGGNALKAVIKFPANSKEILARASISSVDINGAIHNLESDKLGFDFQHMVENSQKEWELQLQKIKVFTRDDDLKINFYTALYHSYLAPFVFSDVDGRFKGHNHQIKTAKGYTQYTVLSLWDTFRALKPLFNITQPSLINDIVKSMLSQYDDTGFLSKWELMGNETDCMIGFNAAPIITDAIVKEIGDFDREKAYKALKAYAMSDIDGLDYFRGIGYVPSDVINESASKTLEYSYNFWCVGRAAEALGKYQDKHYFYEMSSNYKHLFDKKIQFIRGKQSNGNFALPFDPAYSEHRYDYFTEGNSWQWSWFAPHDTKGLIALHKGEEQFAQKLDSLFFTSSNIKGENASADITGLIGQYAHGNEPSHGTAYLYEVANTRPHRTQEVLDEALHNLYGTGVEGLCGNDDCGQMSAWYIWTSLGLYPFNPADNKYYFGRPLFDKAIIELPNARNITIVAKNVSRENKYIKSAHLNRKKLDRNYISYKELMAGGELVFEMTNRPIVAVPILGASVN